jgi:Uma2 family endonuclease
VVSPSDSAEDLDTKTKQYLQTGARQVWILYPKTQTVQVFSSGAAALILERDQTLQAATCFRDLASPLPRFSPFDIWQAKKRRFLRNESYE